MHVQTTRPPARRARITPPATLTCEINKRFRIYLKSVTDVLTKAFVFPERVETRAVPTAEPAMFVATPKNAAIAFVSPKKPATPRHAPAAARLKTSASPAPRLWLAGRARLRVKRAITARHASTNDAPPVADPIIAAVAVTRQGNVSRPRATSAAEPVAPHVRIAQLRAPPAPAQDAWRLHAQQHAPVAARATPAFWPRPTLSAGVLETRAWPVQTDNRAPTVRVSST